MQGNRISAAKCKSRGGKGGGDPLRARIRLKGGTKPKAWKLRSSDVYVDLIGTRPQHYFLTAQLRFYGLRGPFRLPRILFAPLGPDRAQGTKKRRAPSYARQRRTPSVQIPQDFRPRLARENSQLPHSGIVTQTCLRKEYGRAVTQRAEREAGPLCISLLCMTPPPRRLEFCRATSRTPKR